MPIRPENKNRYPSDWAQISKRIRERSGGVCECTGECGNRHATGRCPARNYQPHPVTDSKVILTVAHLDHTPENCGDDNLKAMCQRCHLSYDRHHHARNAAETRRRAGSQNNHELPL